MSFRSRFKEFMVESAGVFLDKPAAPAEVEAFLARFRSMIVGVDLIRVGGAGDGGYLVPNDLEGVTHCFSPGVDVKAAFENQLAEGHGVRCYMADASVSEPPLANERFEFDPKFLGSRNDDTFITLSEWIHRKVGDADHEMILQMDIEGAEYEVLVETPLAVLERFRMMIVEFHDLERLFDAKMLRLVSAVFAKLGRGFSIAHVHPNNCRGVVSRGGIDVPRVIEVTFVRNDRIDGIASDQPVTLPHPLDEKNCGGLKDIVMPDAWWKAG